ncbi:MAG: SGNH/GDSL hydrolase family protein [Planctomycetaceae bacterium]|nr:SGNH/GDSL hydrolase family protein [Planctomycetaceae bacterium]
MINRRKFLRRSAACTTAIASTSSATQAHAANQQREVGYGYRLPDFAPESRVLFIGDSITDMNWGRNEKDRNHYLGHSYVYLIGARLGVDMAEAKLEFFNRGHSGNRLTDLKNRWQKDVIEMKPDLLSVLIGVNDRKVKDPENFNIRQWEEDYNQLLSRSHDTNEQLRLVLIEPFVLQSGWYMTKGGEWDVSRAQIDQMRGVVTKLAKKFNAVHVPMQEVFDNAAKSVSPDQWIWDGVHPLPQGHELIARNWLDKTSARWS